MLRILQIYKGISKLKESLYNNNIGPETRCLVKIITSSMEKDVAVQTAKDIKEILPNGEIVGSTSSQSVIFNGEQMDGETLIVIEIYEKLSLQVETFQWKNKSAAQLAGEVQHAFTQDNGAACGCVHILFSDRYYDVQKFVKEINELTPVIPMAGGIAGDIVETNMAGFVFTDEGIIDCGAIAFTASGKKARDFMRISASMEAISSVYEITKVSGSSIEEIEGENALNWFYSYLNVGDDKKVPIDDWVALAERDYLIHFPIMIENTKNCGRFTRYDAQSNNLGIYFSQLEKGTKFRVGYVNPDKTIQEIHQICEDILDAPVESLFVYTCFFRKLYLQNCSKWELTPFAKYNVCGIYMMGEIAFQDGKNNFYNGICNFVGLAENEKYIIPDIKALQNSTIIKDDITFASKAREKSKDGVLEQKSALLNRIEQYDHKDIVSHYMDLHFNVPNVYQYEQDKITYGFDKICLIELQTADSTIAFLGQEQYYQIGKDIVQIINSILLSKNMDSVIKLYVMNYKTFILTAGDDLTGQQFKEFMENSHEEFEHVTSKETGASCVARFIVVLNQGNMIDTGVNVLYANKDIKDNFIVCDNITSDEISYYEELQAINLLKYAIDKNKIVPFYQGIYNNKTGQIDKYESLMRVIDINGNIVTPFVFMDISKKYNYYNRISQMMLTQVFKDFKDLHASVSMNISYNDIESPYFRQWFLEELGKFGETERIIVEFVETEHYKSQDILFDFLKQIKETGAQIAIDDFGSGYSTLSILLMLKPDYIKIDGSIISKIVDNEDNQTILDTVNYIAKKMKSKTIAEFVENEAIQNVIMSYGVSFSQGYFFAKPKPLAELDLLHNQ